jgi:hypothetical protein
LCQNGGAGLPVKRETALSGCTQEQCEPYGRRKKTTYGRGKKTNMAQCPEEKKRRRAQRMTTLLSREVSPSLLSRQVSLNQGLLPCATSGPEGSFWMQRLMGYNFYARNRISHPKGSQIGYDVSTRTNSYSIRYVGPFWLCFCQIPLKNMPLLCCKGEKVWIFCKIFLCKFKGDS